MDGPRVVKYRSSRDPDVIYEATIDSCTCPAGVHRKQCSHMLQLQRWRDWGMTEASYPPEDTVLEPPPSADAWQMEYLDGSDAES